MPLSTPVAFFIFNRPHLTEKVFAAIAQAQPQVLFVVADGPRFPEEAEKCDRARKIIDQIDWQCQLITNFSEINLGCRTRISSGLDWVFSQVEEAIILEDDCLPSPSFFHFCQDLLEYYRHDERIMVIGGNNYQASQPENTEYSYYFSKYGYTHGWASWRRAWKFFDVEMKTWPAFRDSNILRSIYDSAAESQYWTEIFNRAYQNQIDTWDYQWLYACWCQNGLSITPSVNLVSNIGFDADATHCFDKSSPLANLQTHEIWDIKHPEHTIRNWQADRHDFEKIFKHESNGIRLLKKFLKIP